MTAIGLLWTIVDFLCHDFHEENEDLLLQNLWIALYHAIGKFHKINLFKYLQKSVYLVGYLRLSDILLILPAYSR